MHDLDSLARLLPCVCTHFFAPPQVIAGAHGAQSEPSSGAPRNEQKPTREGVELELGSLVKVLMMAYFSVILWALFFYGINARS